MTARHLRSQTPLSTIALGLEDADALDKGVHAAQPLMDALTSNALIKSALQGHWLGHALHPLLTDVPMGTWMSALLLDLTPADEDGEAARLLTLVGLLAAVPTALSGWAELAEATPRQKRVGLVHAGANAAGVALQVASYAARSRGRRLTGLVLAGAAMTAVGAGGFLGGHLAVAREVGTSDPVFDETR